MNQLGRLFCEVVVLFFTSGLAREIGIVGALIVIAVVLICVFVPLPGMNRGGRRS